MKRNLAFLFLILLLISIFYIKNINSIVLSVLKVFFYGVLPSLGPILVLSYLFINCDGPTYLLQLCQKCRLNTSRSYKAIIIFLGLMAGTSSLSIYVNHGVNEKQLSVKEANHILSSFATPSIPFLIALILYYIKDSVTKWWIIGVVLVVNLLFYMLFSLNEQSKYHSYKFKPLDVNINKLFEKSLVNAAKALLLILGTTISFSLLLILFNNLLNPHDSIAVLGFFEYSYSLSLLLSANTPPKILVITAIVSFGSIATFLHIKWLCPSVNFFSLVKVRALITIFNILLTYLVLLI